MAPRRDVAPPATEADAVARLAERLARVEENIGSVFPGSGEWEFRQVGAGLRVYNRRSGRFGDIVQHVPNLAALPSGDDLYRGIRVYVEDIAADLVWYGPVTGWRPPWNMPWGKLVGLRKQDGSTFAVAVGVEQDSGLALTTTAFAGRSYLVTASSSMYSPAGAVNFGLRVYVPGGLFTYAEGTPRPSLGTTVTVTDVYEPTSTMVGQFKTTGQFTTFGGIFLFDASRPWTLTVTDVGPAATAPLSAPLS